MLAHGRSFEVACTWPDDVPLQRGTVRECFRNCTIAALDNPRFVYCEGLADAVIPVEHAWVYDLQTGISYDLTWEGGRDYFGVPFAEPWLRRLVQRNRFYGVFGTRSVAPRGAWRHPSVPK